jgi:lipopolysaccharide biosynthesis glycosyltransferase
MQTKLVYVLTCAPEATYIEQALISIWSARYHNPDAHIVLLVDDKTNELLVGKRAEVLGYVTEKVVIPFEDANASMMYRSRWIKTQVRQLVNGDLLFIDCDTIVNKSLEEIDEIEAEAAAVPESNLPIADFHPSLYESMEENAKKIGWNIAGEEYYYSSGVIYVKDTPMAHKMFQLWHQYWIQGGQIGINIDQPSLAKANIECGHLIERIDNKWNCIMFTYPRWAKNAYILHYAAYRNMSFLFSKRVLKYIREYGLIDYLRSYIIDSTASYIPFNSEFYHYSLKDYRSRFRILYKGIRDYAEHIDATFEDYSPKNIVYKLLRGKWYRLATIVLLLLSYRRVRLNKNYKYTENICSK